MTEKKENVMVWKDDSGTYKLGYSQYLQQELLKTNKLLLISVVILIVIMLFGGLYAYTLVQRIDAINFFSRMAPGILFH